MGILNIMGEPSMLSMTSLPVRPATGLAYPPFSYSSKWNLFFYVSTTTALYIIDVSNVTNPTIFKNDSTLKGTGICN